LVLALSIFAPFCSNILGAPTCVEEPKNDRTYRIVHCIAGHRRRQSLKKTSWADASLTI
jgi:hypothetical protein